MAKKFLLAVLIVLFTLTGCSKGVSQEAYDALLAENEQLKQRLSQYENISEIPVGNITNNEQADGKKTLAVDEWVSLNVDGTELRFKFDGFTPIQDKGTFGKYVMMLCSIENVSNSNYEAYFFFEDIVKITDAEGFLLTPSGNGWDYEVYGCDTNVNSGEKKRIVKAFAYDADVSDLTLTLSDGEVTYVYTSSISNASNASSDTSSNDTASCDHVWSEATLADSSYCTICGEENLFGWSISTSYIMGTWNAEYYYCEGEVISGSAANFEARFVTDGTGYMKLDGEKYPITWSFSQEVDDMIIYRVMMDGDIRQIGYVTDFGNDFYHKLMFELEDDLYVILKKTA